MKATTYQKVCQALQERFGTPIGKAQDAGDGVADETGGRPKKGPQMGNRGFGSSLDETNVCQSCGSMMPMDEKKDVICDQCGMMAPMDEMKLGISDRSYGLPDRRDSDDVREPEEVGAHLEPKSTFEMPKTSATHLKRRSTDLDEDDMHADEMAEANMIEDKMDEIAPPGGEKVVKALKKAKGVKNPYAVAWSMKDKGDRFKK